MTASPGFWWYLGSFLLIIGPLIFLHELGHYLVGRWCGVKAECFSIGFGRELVGWTDARGTRWKVSLLPLGGYVKFAGDMGVASAPSPEWLALPPAERNRTFQAKRVWQRFLIVLAGPAANFLLAFLLFAGLFAAVGRPSTPAVVRQVVAGSPAAKAGIVPGDRITALAWRRVSRIDDVQRMVIVRPGETLGVDVARGGRPLHLTVTVGETTVTDRFGDVDRIGMIGVVFLEQPTLARLPLAQVPGAALDQMASTVDTIVAVLRQVIVGERSVGELHGPVGTAKIAGEVATLGWIDFAFLMASISINLGFINLLPIPMLDGGHLLFYLVEAVKRRPVGQRVQELAFRSGLALVVAFMLVVTAHDIASLQIWRQIAG